MQLVSQAAPGRGQQQGLQCSHVTHVNPVSLGTVAALGPRDQPLGKKVFSKGSHPCPRSLLTPLPQPLMLGSQGDTQVRSQVTEMCLMFLTPARAPALPDLCVGP